MEPRNDILTGGAYYSLGLWPVRVRFPFASLEISTEALTMVVDRILWQTTYRFPRNTITALRPRRVWWSHGFEIEHSLGQPKSVIFLPPQVEVCALRLQGAGYKLIV